MKRILLSSIVTICFAINGFSQEENTTNKIYTTAGGNGGILSFADIKEDDDRINSIPRFTFFFNFGTNFNYDVSENFGFFSGLNVKNIGLITKEDNLKLKRRVYTIGVPVGFKAGNLEKGAMFFGGAELDFAFNYKEKRFVNGDKVSKFNEWFSDRTPVLMPSVFAGVRFSRHFNFKAQYYLTNFFNTSYKDDNSLKPYQNTDARLFFITLGYDFEPKQIFN